MLVAAAGSPAHRDPAILENEGTGPRDGALRLARQIERAGGRGLLDQEQFSSDVRRRVLGLHGQAIAWQGLLALGREPGMDTLAWRPAPETRPAATPREGPPLCRSSPPNVACPTARCSCPSLLDGVRPFDRVTASRDGSYWNLVMPYALASGLLDPSGSTARGIWRYMSGHGALLLGSYAPTRPVSTGALRIPPPASTRSTALDLARFLADADLPDRLVLSLYGTLAGAMTRNTFVSGEAATLAPLRGSSLGSMYMPPNGGTSTAFLETLRLVLVHERRDARGAPVGLELAFATPRAWLSPGRTIRVEDAPTSFGPMSYAISRHGLMVQVVLEAPPTPALHIRLRLPRGERIARVDADGRSVPFDATTATIELRSGAARSLRLVARVELDERDVTRRHATPRERARATAGGEP